MVNSMSNQIRECRSPIHKEMKMRKALLLSLLALPFGTAFAQTTSVLFLGNSYTGTNSLVPKFVGLCQAAGDTVYTDSNTPGGHTLEGHSSNATSIAKIYERNWDFVVLQEQSQRPSFPPSQVANEVYPYAEILCDTIRANYECTEPVFYMTWGRRSGDQQNCQFYTPLCTFEGMSTRLRSSYLEMAEDNDARVAPCGAAWSRMDIADTTFFAALYTGDGSHPSTYGQYLNACVFYATIFKKTPVGIPYYANISQVDAETLQAYAEEIVMDSLDNWNVDVALPSADMDSVTSDGFVFNFVPVSTGSFGHEWDFGDGATSAEESPTHDYGIPNASFDVTHIVTDDCGRTDTLVFTVQTALAGLADQENDLIKVANQTNGLYTILIRDREQYQASVTDMTGRLVSQFNLQQSATVDLSGQRVGIYSMTLVSATGKRKVIKLTR